MATPESQSQFQVANVDGIITVSGCLDFTTATQVLGAVNEHMLAIPAGNSDTHSDTLSAIQTIDLAAVTHCNSAGLALLIEWLAEAQRTGRNIRFENIPNSLRQISTVCQVDSLI